MVGAIFDVDGTLLDSMGVWYAATEHYFAINNRTLPQDLGKSFTEMTLDESTTYMHEVLNFCDTPDEINHSLKDLVRTAYRDNVPLKPYAKEYVLSLHKQGVRLALATSGYLNLCKTAFERHGMWHLFDAVALSSEVGVNKSNPDIYLLAAQRLGVDPQNCTVYEDIVTGIYGAKKAGMKTVGVWDASNTDPEKLKSTAHKYVHDFSELL